MFFHCRALGGIGHFLSICRKILNWKWIWFSAKCCVLSAKSFFQCLVLLSTNSDCFVCYLHVMGLLFDGIQWGISMWIVQFLGSVGWHLHIFRACQPTSAVILWHSCAAVYLVSLNLYQNVNRAGGILSSCNMAKWHQQHSHTYAHELGKYKNSSLHIWIRKWTEQMPLFCLWIWWMYKRPSHWGTLILNCLRIFTLWYGKQYNQKEV